MTAVTTKHSRGHRGRGRPRCGQLDTSTTGGRWRQHHKREMKIENSGLRPMFHREQQGFRSSQVKSNQAVVLIIKVKRWKNGEKTVKSDDWLIDSYWLSGAQKQQLVAISAVKNGCDRPHHKLQFGVFIIDQLNARGIDAKLAFAAESETSRRKHIDRHPKDFTFCTTLSCLSAINK